MNEVTNKPWKAIKNTAGDWYLWTRYGVGPAICRMEPRNAEAHAAHIIKCVNMHDGLVAACDKSNGAATNIVANLEGYESMTPDQLRFKAEIVSGLLKVICNCTKAALAEHAEVTG